MRNRIFERIGRDERGMSVVFVAVGVAAFLSATTLAIDVGLFMNARAQAQNAADAGALSTITALYFNDWADRSAGGPAVMSGMNAAKANKIIGEAPSVWASDVTFPLSPAGQDNRAQVDVYRTSARDNALPTLMGSMFGVHTVNIAATATAEATPANAMTCVKPFMIPDKWEEVHTPPWDPSDTFEMYDNKGNLLPDGQRDIYFPARNCIHCKDNPSYTGYTVKKDKGMQLVLRAGTGNNINPSFYYSWKMPDAIGGSFYEENIMNCNMSIIRWYDLLIQEPGNMSGPTIHGIEALIAKDPDAYWDATCKCVKNSQHRGQSPRVFPIPLYDPVYYAEGKANGRYADFRDANFLGFFADHVQGNEIYGYVTNITGVVDPIPGGVPASLFPVSIRLVQ